MRFIRARQHGWRRSVVTNGFTCFNSNTVLESDITNSISSYENSSDYISETFKWTSNPVCNTIFIPCTKGDSFKLLCTTNNYYAILSAIPNIAATCCGNSLDSSWKTGCSDARIALLTDGTYQPDIIMIFIGINDWIQDKTLGTFNPRTLVPADGNLNVFVDAYMKMIAKIQAAYTKARIFCCTLMATAHDTHDVDQIYPDINDNGVSLYEFNQVIRQICDAMGVDVIELSRCGLHFDNLSYYADADLIHPNSYGMELMANKAEAELLAKY